LGQGDALIEQQDGQRYGQQQQPARHRATDRKMTSCSGTVTSARGHARVLKEDDLFSDQS
jgi:hypothetical protein